MKHTTQSKIDQLNETMLIDEQVFGLDISVDNVIIIEILERQENLSCQVLDLFLREVLLGFHDSSQFSALDHWHYEEESLLSLEKVVHTANERMIGLE